MTIEKFINYLPLANPILIFAGWWFIRKNAKIFAARTEANSIAKEIQQITDDISVISRKYWLDDKHDNHTFEIIVLAALDRLKTKIEILKNYGIVINDSDYISYRRTLTLVERTETSSKYNCNIAFSEILKQTTLLNNHIDELISRTNINNSVSFYQNIPFISGLLLGVIFSFIYLIAIVVN